MTQQDRFQQKYGPWAVITGASDGIGRAFAEALGQRGLHVALVARRKERLDELAGQLRAKYGIHTLVIPCDLSQPSGIQQVLDATASLDAGLLVASAGFGTSGPLLQASLDEERAMLAVNCEALLVHATGFSRRFAARGRGGVVLMSSLLGWQGTPYAAHYAATKAYVQSLAEGLRRELKGAGVDVLASAPGPVHSGFAAVANMKMGLAVLPAAVAQQSLAALGRRTTTVPGLLSKLLTYSLDLLPRPFRVRIMEQVMRGMTQHQLSPTN